MLLEKQFNLFVYVIEQSIIQEEKLILYQNLRVLSQSIKNEQDPKKIQEHLMASPFIETGYSVGKKLITQEHFSQAEAIFSVLVLIAPTVLDFWLALGLAQKGNGAIGEALRSFERAFEVSSDPLALVFRLECLIETNQRQIAQEEFKHLERLIKDSIDFNLKTVIIKIKQYLFND